VGAFPVAGKQSVSRPIYNYIEGVSGGRVKILGAGSMDYSE